MGFNEFPKLPDRFIPPPPPVVVFSSSSSDSDDSEPEPPEVPPEVQARYRAHCLPDIDQIVARVREVRASLLPMSRLTRVYALTNGRPEWLKGLKEALQADARREGLEEWEHIGTSRDLRLTKEQNHNKQAVDMAVAQRAEVFLGNGVRFLIGLPPVA